MFGFLTERRSNRIISNTFRDELDEVLYNGQSIENSLINQLINSNDQFVNAYLGLSPSDHIRAPRSKDRIKFFDDFDNLSTVTEEYDSDMDSILSDDETIVFDMKNTKKFKLIHKLQSFFFNM